MNRSSIVVGVLVLTSACSAGGPGEALPSTVATVPTTTTTTQPTTTAPAEPVADMLRVRLVVPERIVAGPVTWTVEVTNRGEGPVTLTFPTGQDAEVTLVEDADDDPPVVVHRWSDGLFFDQAIRTVPIEAGATVTFELPTDLTAVPAATYDAVVTLVTTDRPEPVVTPVRVRAAPTTTTTR